MKRPTVWKWLFYGAALLPLCLLDGLVFGRIAFWGAKPFLLPFAVSLVAIWEGAVAGAVYGIYVGYLASLLGHGVHTSFLFLFSLLGFLVGSVLHNNAGFLSCLLLSMTALFGLCLVRMVFHTVWDEASFFSLFRITGPELLWSFLFFPLVYGLYRWVSRRVVHPLYL